MNATRFPLRKIVAACLSVCVVVCVCEGKSLRSALGWITALYMMIFVLTKPKPETILKFPANMGYSSTGSPRLSCCNYRFAHDSIAINKLPFAHLLCPICCVWQLFGFKLTSLCILFFQSEVFQFPPNSK